MGAILLYWKGICGDLQPAARGLSSVAVGVVVGEVLGLIVVAGTISCIIIPMIELNIPGQGGIQIEHLVCDVNGTIAVDGQLIDGLVRRLTALRDRLNLHLITADAHGRQSIIDRQLNIQAIRLQSGTEKAQKAEYVRSLGAERVVAIGQGANDGEMLRAARLGICVISPEGTAIETLLAADLVVPDIFAALELIEKPLRIVTSLRR